MGTIIKILVIISNCTLWSPETFLIGASVGRPSGGLSEHFPPLRAKQTSRFTSKNSSHIERTDKLIFK